MSELGYLGLQDKRIKGLQGQNYVIKGLKKTGKS